MTTTTTDNTEFEKDWEWWTSLDSQWQGLLLKEGLKLEHTNFDWRDKEAIQGYLTQILDLTQLTLIDCDIRSLAPLEKLTHLTYLDLSGNDITNLKPLSELTQLTHLNLERNNIHIIEPLAKLKNLMCLDLSHNKRLTDIAPLANLTHLTELSMWRCLNIEGISPLANLAELKQLDLRQIDIPKADIAWPKEKLPNCSISM